MSKEKTAAGPEPVRMRVLFFVSAAAFCVLLLRPLKTSFLVAPVSVAALTALLIRFFDHHGEKAALSRRQLLEAAAVSVLLGGVFAAVWLRTLRLVSLQFIDWKRSLPVLAAAVCAVPLAVPFLSRVLAAISVCRENTCGQIPCAEPTETGKKNGLTPEDRRLLLCTAAVAVSVCSLSSPLYPFNNWVDANCFFTVGKSMLSGVLPYRDLYEQKGPLLYALYALAYPVSHRSFFGVWLMEIAAAYAFLNLSYRTMQLIMGRKSPPALLLTAVLVYTAPAFLKGGSAEEFCLPLMMLSVYYGTSVVLQNRELTCREALLIGLSSGAVLWVKYSMLGFYFGFILVPAWQMLRKRRAVQLLKLIGLIVAGVILASLPVLLYFGLNGAISDLWTAYFYNNIVVYGKGSSLAATVRGLLSGAASVLTFNDATVLLALFAVVSLFRDKQRAYGSMIGLSFMFAFFVIYMGGINMKYYSEILCIFVPVGVAQLWKTAARLSAEPERPEQNPVRNRNRLVRILVPLLFAAALFGSENSEMLQYRRADLPQYQFAETIVETPGATLFNYGALDIGQYTVNDILPTCRYFCMLNIQSDEMFREMDRYMAEGVTDYIVSRGLPVESPHYTLIQTAYFVDDGTEYPYYLYRNHES
ncbi:MAG: hypothetical protein J6W44_03865 [Oscillospiraceae bacterium]|nr:hypothetical protein [Oscillospiraceae bacterium]